MLLSMFVGWAGGLITRVYIYFFYTKGLLYTVLAIKLKSRTISTCGSVLETEMSSHSG